jgi:hypothetical protein
MSILELRILSELQKLHEAEGALEGMYKTLHRSSPAARACFMASLRNLDERLDLLANLLERAA